MSIDPRSIHYPTLDERDLPGNELADSAVPEATAGGDHPDRRAGTDDEVKELDRAERRKR